METNNIVSTWVKVISYDGSNLTITPRKGNPFTLKNVGGREVQPVYEAIKHGRSVGKALQPIIDARR